MPEPPATSTKLRSGVGLDDLLGSCNHGPASLAESVTADAAGSDGLSVCRTRGLTERPAARSATERVPLPVARSSPEHTPEHWRFCCGLTPELSRAAKRRRLGRIVRDHTPKERPAGSLRLRRVCHASARAGTRRETTGTTPVFPRPGANDPSAKPAPRPRLLPPKAVVSRDARERPGSRRKYCPV